VQWIHLHPLLRVVKKIFRGNLQGKFVNATPGHEVHPPARAEEFLGHFLLGGLDLEVYLDRLLRATTIKGRQFFDEKSAPQTKS